MEEEEPQYSHVKQTFSCISKKPEIIREKQLISGYFMSNAETLFTEHKQRLTAKESKMQDNTWTERGGADSTFPPCCS